MKTTVTTAIIALAACLAALALSSCAGVISGLTGQPVHTTPVARDGGTPINVATADLLQAEAQPEKAWGLYDAGAVADFTSQARDAGKSSSKSGL